MWRQNDKDHAKWEETQCLTFFLVCSQERIKGNNVKKREPAYEAVHSAKDCEGDDSPFYRQQSLNSSHSHLHLGGVQYSCSHKKADDWTAMTLPSLIFNQIFCDNIKWGELNQQAIKAPLKGREVNEKVSQAESLCLWPTVSCRRT